MIIINNIDDLLDNMPKVKHRKMRPAQTYRQTDRGLVAEIAYPRTVRECILAMALTLGDGVEVDHYGQIGTGTRKERDKALIALGMEAARYARNPDGDE